MRCVLAILVVLSIGGCSSPAPVARNEPPKSDLQSNFGPNVKQEYAKQILAQLDRFSNISRNTETLDDKSLKVYQQEGRFSKALLQRMNEGLAAETKWIQTVKEMHPPAEFEAFHRQVIKNNEQKLENLGALILALESNNQQEIAKVLDQVEVTGKLRKREMDKILQGKTAEQYLGLT